MSRRDPQPSEARLRVRVHPGARENAVVSFQGDVLRVRVTAPPERGKANEGVAEVLAKALAVPKGRIRLVKGAASRDKLFAVERLDAAEARRRLELALHHGPDDL